MDDPNGDDMAALLKAMTPELTTADRIALIAGYDQLFRAAMQLPPSDLRTQLLGLTPGRAAVAALAAFGGFVSYLGHPDDRIDDQVRSIVSSSMTAADYRELR